MEPDWKRYLVCLLAGSKRRPAALFTNIILSILAVATAAPGGTRRLVAAAEVSAVVAHAETFRRFDTTKYDVTPSGHCTAAGQVSVQYIGTYPIFPAGIIGRSVGD
jgi:hypothetical protein